MVSSDANVVERLARIEESLGFLVEQTSQMRAFAESITRLQERSVRHEESIDLLFKRLSESSSTLTIVDHKIEKWVNRGIGGYVVATLMVGAIIAMGHRIVSAYDERLNHAGVTLNAIDRRVTWIEYELKLRAGPNSGGRQ